MPLDSRLAKRLEPRLKQLYGAAGRQCLERILQRVQRTTLPRPQRPASLWDQRDVVLITYADQVRDTASCPLAALGRFLAQTELYRLLKTIHLLPCFPYSSDDGFSVIDYRQIDPVLGEWSDVRQLGQQYDLMLDLVLNHVSRASAWFTGYQAGQEPYTRYFIEADPEADLSEVTRPRNLPLLTPIDTTRGRRHVWTTFSDDQIDLNYAEPDVLVEMIDVLMLYLEQGARIVRLDAIAYLWKEQGTSCIHLPQTHTVVKLLRDLVDEVAPGAILLTETNVPHRENVSYLGNGDEAQMVYQFSLAPLLVEALQTGQADLLVEWLKGLEPLLPGTTALNFTASHDGIGVRPLEGLMPPKRFGRLIQAVRQRGGRVSTKRNPDGTESPYELNITYFSALAEPGMPEGALVQIQRFLASQALMLALRGIPAVYFHSLLGTPNDLTGVERTGRARSINRRKFRASELRALLDDPKSPSAMVLAAYRAMLAARIVRPAFHPDADQEVLTVDSPSVVALLRTSVDGSDRVLVLANLGPEAQSVQSLGHRRFRLRQDLLAPSSDPSPTNIPVLGPYQVAWWVV
ncbi:MAG: DUF3459 domain-containing protein [Pirellulales bacterium]|nr:DUF3459 domain-containing protein [Pirellulales bacterium]